MASTWVIIVDHHLSHKKSHNLSLVSTLKRLLFCYRWLSQGMRALSGRDTSHGHMSSRGHYNEKRWWWSWSWWWWWKWWWCEMVMMWCGMMMMMVVMMYDGDDDVGWSWWLFMMMMWDDVRWWWVRIMRVWSIKRSFINLVLSIVDVEVIIINTIIIIVIISSTHHHHNHYHHHHHIITHRYEWHLHAQLRPHYLCRLPHQAPSETTARSSSCGVVCR